MDGIPATFRDTIRVVRQLNIPYLWIDCYCIIQSEEYGTNDKLMEIAKMGEVYSNGILNIAATSAKSPLDGLFSRRESKCHCRPMTIDFTEQSQLETSNYLLYPASCNGRDHDLLFPNQISFTSTRAWCMQERFLCPRMLHFWKYGVFWECHSMYSGSERLPTQTFPVEETKNYTPFSLRTGSEIPASEHLREWRQIVATYSTMGLSRPNKDKLAACGAVAKLMAELIGDEYIAGHFRQSLVPSLTWMISHNHQSWGMTNQRSNVWRAPSWSWTSMDGAVTIDRDDDDDESQSQVLTWKRVKPRKLLTELDETKESDEAEADDDTVTIVDKPPFGPCTHLISLDIDLVDPLNPYGALKSAAITIKGPVTEVEHDATPNAHRQEWQNCIRWGDNQIDVIFDDPIEPRSNLAILLTRMRRGRMHSMDFKYGGPMMRGPGPLLSGLVLVVFQQGPHGQPDVYRRVGAFREQYYADSQQISRSGYKRPEFLKPEDRVIMII